MKDSKTDTIVSPYLLRPLRTVEQAADDLNRHNDAIAEACRRNQRGTLVAFPLWRRQHANWRRAILRGLRRPA